MGKNRETPIGFWDWTFYRRGFENIFFNHKTQRFYENREYEKLYRMEKFCMFLWIAFVVAILFLGIWVVVTLIGRIILFMIVYTSPRLFCYFAYRKYLLYDELHGTLGDIKRQKRYGNGSCIGFFIVWGIFIVTLLICFILQ
ncbi:MAG: hypothetical protein VB082_08045 [Christensenella sp.]|nr:hypothetical protein [Christensenella sp.]